MATKHLDADLSGTPVDQTKYRSMVGALMYLTASRPDIVHTTCYCARYQAKPIEKHLTTVKRIFRYLKDSINMGLWDNYYGKQYYHGGQLNASLMVSGLHCYTPVIGKITVVILVRDRCPRGKVLEAKEPWFSVLGHAEQLQGVVEEL
ncbi:hypothetical protein Tco_1096741 [Tanacetum coccineum]